MDFYRLLLFLRLKGFQKEEAYQKNEKWAIKYSPIIVNYLKNDSVILKLYSPSRLKTGF